MIGREDRPRIAPKARLRFDRRTGGYLLLYPEMGLELDDTAAEILLRCDGAHSVAAIAEELAARYAAPLAEVESDVLELLGELAGRAVVRI